MTLDPTDRLEIQDLYMTYCRELDIGSPDGWSGCFVDDGCFQRVDGDEVLMEVGGRDDLARLVEKVHDTEMGTIRRWCANVLLTEEDGEVHGRSYLTMVKVATDEPESSSSDDVPGSLYTGSASIVTTSLTEDTLERSPAGWRFRLRRVQMDSA